MTRVTEKPVNRIMKSFVDQPGAPVLSVSSRCVAGATEVTVRQQRFVGRARTPPTPRRPRRRRRGRCRCASRRRSGEPACTLVTERQQTTARAGLRRGDGQRRRARLLPHRVRAGRRGGARHAHAAADAGRAHQPARRRMAHGARRPPRHRHLSRPRRRVCRRRHAGGAGRSRGPRRLRRELRGRRRRTARLRGLDRRRGSARRSTPWA